MQTGAFRQFFLGNVQPFPARPDRHAEALFYIIFLHRHFKVYEMQYNNRRNRL